MRMLLTPFVLAAAMMMGEAEKVPIPGSERWLLRWGQDVTANDQCPVRKARLNTKMPPVWVNGRAIGFC